MIEVKIDINGMTKEQLNSKTENLIERLLGLGRETAQLSYDANTIDYDGDTIQVSTMQSGKSGEVIASGDTVLFQEYGTGVGATHPEGASLGYTPGSWSKTHAQQFYKYGYWYYNGRKLTGQPASMGMYYARKTIEDNAIKTAEEVYKW